MDQVNLLFFSLDHEGICSFTDDLQRILDTKSANYDGPVQLPVYYSSVSVEELDSVPIDEWATETPGWLRDVELAESDYARLRSYENVEELTSFALFGRLFIVNDSDAARRLLDFELPDSICLHMEVDTVQYDAGGRGTPHGYDPSQDYVTDVDFEAHYS